MEGGSAEVIGWALIPTGSRHHARARSRRSSSVTSSTLSTAGKPQDGEPTRQVRPVQCHRKEETQRLANDFAVSIAPKAWVYSASVQLLVRD
jgi:hypothetical protein